MDLKILLILTKTLKSYLSRKILLSTDTASIFDVLVHIISLDEPVIIIGIFLLLFGHSF